MALSEGIFHLTIGDAEQPLAEPTLRPIVLVVLISASEREKSFLRDVLGLVGAKARPCCKGHDRRPEVGDESAPSRLITCVGEAVKIRDGKYSKRSCKRYARNTIAVYPRARVSIRFRSVRSTRFLDGQLDEI